jgi:hypothetical protein
MTFETSRYGAFVQTSYKFNGLDLADPTSKGIFKATPVMGTN